jgi:hypothetical protein
VARREKERLAKQNFYLAASKDRVEKETTEVPGFAPLIAAVTKLGYPDTMSPLGEADLIELARRIKWLAEQYNLQKAAHS